MTYEKERKWSDRKKKHIETKKSANLEEIRREKKTSKICSENLQKSRIDQPKIDYL